MGYIGNDPNTGTLEQNALLSYTATSGQTAFTGADANGFPLDIGPNSDVKVFMNGVLLDPTDYTQTANTITLASGAAVGAEIRIFVDKQFQVANSYSKTEVNTLIANDNVTDDGNSLLNALIFGG
ncbi:MAG: hypothetical protein CMH04_04300 [Marinovum sp.]|nr:hypothetical protein [Marinovum sp.]